MTEIPKCNRACTWINGKYNLDNNTFAILCGATEDPYGRQELVTAGKSQEPLRSKWTSEVNVNAETEPCLAPKKRNIVPFEDRPFGGIDPFSDP